jgi:hypothetical protein
MDWTYGMYVGEEKCVWDSVGKPEGKRPLGRVVIDGMIILKWI